MNDYEEGLLIQEKLQLVHKMQLSEFCSLQVAVSSGKLPNCIPVKHERAQPFPKLKEEIHWSQMASKLTAILSC